MKENNLDHILWEAIRSVVESEHRPFTYGDIVEKGVKIANGTFRNKISKLLHTGQIKVVYYSPNAFYTIKDTASELMTDDPTAATSPLHNKHNYRNLSNDPVYRIIQNIPLGKRSVHDIRLKFAVRGIWSVLSSKFEPNECSKDIQLVPWPWKINNLDLKVTIHSTDTVGIDIGCSYCPVAVDIDGVVRLSNALVTIRERLSNIIENCTNDQKSSLSVPEHMTWIVSMWHFGADALIDYKGEKFHTTWEVGQHALIMAYVKEWTDGKKRLRIEKQEYPQKSLAQALEDKLNGVRNIKEG